MSLIGHLLDAARWKYLWSGSMKRLTQSQRCPCCRSPVGETIDRKLIYSFVECRECRLCYRFPYETAAELSRYYERVYEEHGLTTDLPDDRQLSALVHAAFAGTEKDFSRVVNLLRALGVVASSSVLDFGSNWGYGAWQLARAGFSVEAYEPAAPRAAFGARLGLTIRRDLTEVGAPFDVVYSSHVLEHVSNPLDCLHAQIQLAKGGGFVVAHTPNGSAPFRIINFDSFHRLWGLPHPVLLTDAFLLTNFRRYPLFVSTSGGAKLDEELRQWERRRVFVGDLTGSELVIVMVTPLTSGSA